MNPLEQLIGLADEQPNDPRVWCRLALAFEETAQPDRAKDALRRARATQPSTPDEWVEIAATSERLGDLQQAAAAYRRAVQLDRRCVAAYLALGDLLMRVGDTRAAALTLRVAVSHSPESAELALLFSKALELENQPEEAEAEARRAAQLAPPSPHSAPHPVLRDDYATLSAYGHQLMSEGRRDDCVEMFIRAMEQAPLEYDAHIRLGQILLDLTLYSLATRALKEAIRIRPNVPEGHLKLGMAHEAAGNIYDAVVSYRTAVLIAPQLARAHYLLGLALRRTGELREAASSLVKAAANAPEDADIKAALDLVTQEKNETRRAPLPRGVSEGSVGSFGGDLSVFALPEMLEFLSNRRTSGTLQIVSSYGEGLIELHRGQIVRVSSPQKKPLVRVLEEHALVAPNDLRRAFDGFAGTDDDTIAGERLVAQKLVERSVILEGMKRQVRASLRELVSWKEGEVTFHAVPSRDVPREDPEFSVDTKWLLFEVMAGDTEDLGSS